MFTVIQAGKAVVIGGGEDDFSTFTKNISPFIFCPKDVTNNGWTMNIGNILGPMSWAGKVKVPCIIGNIDNPGNIVSPILNGGCGTLTVQYGTDMVPTMGAKNGLKYKIEVKDRTGIVKFTKEVFNPLEELVQRKIMNLLLSDYSQRGSDSQLSGNPIAVGST